MSKKYKKRKKRSTVEATRRRAEQHKAGYEITSLDLPEGTPLFRLKSAKAVRLDIIPYEVGEGNPYADKGELHYERTFFVHRGIGVNQSSYVCLRKTINEKCPICEHRAKLMRDPDADEDLIKDLAPKERQLFNVIDTAERDKGIQVWDVSFHLFGKALDARIRNADEDDEYENFAELADGLTLKLGIGERSFGGRSFFAVETIDFKARKEDYGDEILEEVYNLDEIIKVLDYDELKAAFLQMEDEEEEEEEEPERKSSKKKSKKAEDEDKDFDEDDEDSLADLDDEDDEDEFEQHRDEITLRCRQIDLDSDDYETWKEAEMAVRGAKEEGEEEDEDLDDDFDEDFDEEEPAKKTKKKAAKKAKKKTTKKKSSKKGRARAR